MRFILDEDIAREIANILQYVYGDGTRIEFMHVTGLGPAYEKSVDQWMISACGPNDVIVTADKNNKTRISDREIAAAGNRMMVLGGWFDHERVQPRARWFLKHAEELIRLGGTMKPGTIWSIDKRCRTGSRRR